MVDCFFARLKFMINYYRVKALAGLRDKEKEKAYRLGVKKDLISYIDRKEGDDGELCSIRKWILHNDYVTFPYEFVKKYTSLHVGVKRDEDSGFPYVWYHGRKLYLKKSMNNEQVEEYMRSIYLEQDVESPHRYNYDLKKWGGSSIADMGAAEGFFSLDIIDVAKKIYLFECDPEWIEALKLTFSPYAEKIEIVPKYIDAIADEQTERTTMDEYFAERDLDYVKADVEGYETNMLRGASTVLQKIKGLILCTYHKQDAASEMEDILQPYGFKIKYSDGYMIFLDDRDQKPPYVRHGIMYAEK